MGWGGVRLDKPVKILLLIEHSLTSKTDLHVLHNFVSTASCTCCHEYSKKPASTNGLGNKYLI